MCWPGAHSNNCEDRGKYCSANLPQEDACMERDRDRPPKLQSAIYYALDGDQVNILTMLAQRSEDPWVGSYFFVGIFRFFFILFFLPIAPYIDLDVFFSQTHLAKIQTKCVF